MVLLRHLLLSVFVILIDLMLLLLLLVILLLALRGAIVLCAVIRVATAVTVAGIRLRTGARCTQCTANLLFQGGSRLRHGLRGQFMLPARVHVYGHAIAVAIGRRTLLLRRVALMVLLLLCVVVAAIVTTPIVRWLLLLSHWWAEALVHLLALSMAMRRSLPLLANVRGRGRRSEIRLTCRGA